jgi:hypothetical protein
MIASSAMYSRKLGLTPTTAARAEKARSAAITGAGSAGLARAPGAARLTATRAIVIVFSMVASSPPRSLANLPEPPRAVSAPRDERRRGRDRRRDGGCAARP